MVVWLMVCRAEAGREGGGRDFLRSAHDEHLLATSQYDHVSKPAYSRHPHPHMYLQLVLLLSVSLHHGYGGGLRLVLFSLEPRLASCRLLLSSLACCLALPVRMNGDGSRCEQSSKPRRRDTIHCLVQKWTACTTKWEGKDKFEKAKGELNAQRRGGKQRGRPRIGRDATQHGFPEPFGSCVALACVECVYTSSSSSL